MASFLPENEHPILLRIALPLHLREPFNPHTTPGKKKCATPKRHEFVYLCSTS